MHAVDLAPYLKKPRYMRTLGDALASILSEWSKQPRELKKKNWPSTYLIRCAAHTVSTILEKECSRISLDELVGLSPQLVQYALAEGSRNSFYARPCRKILAHAKAHGWTSDAMALRDSWRPVKEIFKRRSLGCLQIIDALIACGKSPEKTAEADLQFWRDQSIKNGLSRSSIEQYIPRFRRLIRAAGQQERFPQLDFRLRRLPRYGDTLDAMSAQTQAELQEIAVYRTSTWLPDRSAHIAVREMTVESMMKSFRQLHGFRTQIQKKRRVAGLCELVKPATVLPYIDWLASERSLLRDSIQNIFAPILVVLRHHPLFKGQNYEWISERIQQIPREQNYKRTERKEAKAVPYELLATIPSKLRLQSEAPGLSAVDIAWFRHDEAVIAILLHLVYRQRNIRECGIAAPASVNVIRQRITPNLLNNGNCPDWVRAAHAANPRREFWMFSFMENETKAARAVRDLVPLEIISVLEEYLDIHRPILIDPSKDHGRLFFNRRGKSLSEDNLRQLIRRLTGAYIGRKIAPHLWRDIYAVYFRVLAATGVGEDFDALHDRLWHQDRQTTETYCQMDYALPGIVALNREFSTSLYN